jgi:hypothetical protein
MSKFSLYLICLSATILTGNALFPGVDPSQIHALLYSTVPDNVSGDAWYENVFVKIELSGLL